MDEASLLEHIPKHKESKHLKTHICQFCGKSYTQETYLAKHLQKHAERAEKQQQQRPATALGGLASMLPRNLSLNNASAVSTGEHPYWPKVSPDSAAATTLAEAMQQNQSEYFSMANAVNNNNNNGEPLHLHRNALLDHHRAMNGAGSPDGVEDLVISGRQSNLSAQQQHQAQQNQHQAQHAQTQHLSQSQLHQQQSSPAPSNNNNIGEGSVTNYDIKTSSAFTPINVSMAPHLNSLAAHHHHPHHPHPHQLAQRPSYLYDTISFGQNVKNMTNHQNVGPGPGPGGAFPNQLISLHQIRSYTHQASAMAGGLMAGEHLLGIGVGGGVGKDKSS